MSLHVLGCPSCSKPFQVASEQAGKVVQCPSCMEQVGIPDDLGAPANPTPEPPAPEPSSQNPIFACPTCQGQFGITPEMYGQNVGCPHCKKPVQIARPEEKEDESAIPIIKKGGRKKKKSGPSFNPDLFAPGHAPAVEPEVNPVAPILPSTSKKRRKSKKKIGPIASDLLPPSVKPADTTKPADAAQAPVEAPATPPAPPKSKSSKPSSKEPQKSSAKPVTDRPKKKSQPAASSKPKHPNAKSESKHESNSSTVTTNEIKPAASNETSSTPASDLPPTFDADAPVLAPASESLPTPPQSASHPESESHAETANLTESESPQDEIVDAEISPLSTPAAVALLLPPRFDVDDPERFGGRKNQSKVLLPTADGGTTKVDDRIVTIVHNGQEVQLIALSPEDRIKYRRNITIVCVLLGVIMMLLAFWLLQTIF